MQKAVTEFTVLENIKLNPANHKIILQAACDLLPVSPGQFANIDITGNREVFLNRPFSFLDVDHATSSVSILVKILGKGSYALSGIRSGSRLSLVYPLGNGFTLPEKEHRVLAIAGGSGIAPVLFLAKKSGLKPSQMHIILGAKNKEDLVPVDDYSPFATFHFTTEDGSCGLRGMVTHHALLKSIADFDRIYTCGPLAMMKAVAGIATRHNLFCEVSLENLMACGFGVCLCCIEPTHKGNLCVCTDGPVFNIRDLLW